MDEKKNGEEKKEESKDSIPKIRTFKTDAEIYLRDNKVSKLDLAAKTYKMQAGMRGATRAAASYKKAILYGLLFMLLLVFLGGGGYFAYNSFLAAPTEAPELPESKPYANFVAVDTEKELALPSAGATSQLAESLLEELKKNLRFNSIVYFKINRPDGSNPFFIGASGFVEIMDWNMPLALASSLLPDFNPLAFYGNNKNSLAVIFLTDNFAGALEGMFGWEKDIWKDWILFLGEQDTQTLSRASFRDATIKNNDARVLYGPGGEAILAYSIFNRRFLIIAASEEALSLILERMIAIPPRI